MKTDLHLWSNLIQVILEWEIIVGKFVEQNKTHLLISTTFFLNHAIYEIE